MHDVINGEHDAWNALLDAYGAPVTRGSYDGMAPSNPVVGHVHYFGTQAARWDGSAWQVQS